MTFKDIRGVEIKEGDYIYHAYTVGRSASLGRRLVVGFTPKMIKVVDPRRMTRYDWNTKTSYTLDEFRGHTTINPKNTVVVNEFDWPEAEEYLRYNPI